MGGCSSEQIANTFQLLIEPEGLLAGLVPISVFAYLNCVWGNPELITSSKFCLLNNVQMPPPQVELNSDSTKSLVHLSH